MGGEIRTVAQVAAAAHHGQIDTGFASLNHHRQDIHIAVVHCVHRLLVQDFGQSADLVAHFSGLLELQALCMGQHALFHRLHHIVGVALQKLTGTLHITLVVLKTDHAHAGCRAALDLVQQTWTVAVAKYRVLAGTQAKYFLNQLNGFAYRPHAGVRTKVIVVLVNRAAVIHHPWRCFGMRVTQCIGSALLGAGDFQIGVALVVPKQDVVARLEGLDEIVFQQQGLGLGTHHRGFKTGNFAHHVTNTGATMVFLEIAADAFFKVVGFAHIQHLTLGVEVAIDPGQRGQSGNLRQQLRIENFGFGHGAMATATSPRPGNCANRCWPSSTGTGTTQVPVMTTSPVFRCIPWLMSSLANHVSATRGSPKALAPLPSATTSPPRLTCTVWAARSMLRQSVVSAEPSTI